MPTLKANDQHRCPLCGYSSKRNHMKSHLTITGKKGPRCPSLSTVISPAVWTKQFIRYYTVDGPLPDLTAYAKKSPGPARRKFADIRQLHNKKRRLSADGEIRSDGVPRLSQDELLGLLHCGGNPDMQWLVGVLREKDGCAKLREAYTVAQKSIPPKAMAPRDALALQTQLFRCFYMFLRYFGVIFLCKIYKRRI